MRIRWDPSLGNLTRDPRNSQTSHKSAGARSSAAPLARHRLTMSNGARSIRRWRVFDEIDNEKEARSKR